MSGFSSLKKEIMVGLKNIIFFGSRIDNPFE